MTSTGVGRDGSVLYRSFTFIALVVVVVVVVVVPTVVVAPPGGAASGLIASALLVARLERPLAVALRNSSSTMSMECSRVESMLLLAVLRSVAANWSKKNRGGEKG